MKSANAVALFATCSLTLVVLVSCVFGGGRDSSSSVDTSGSQSGSPQVVQQATAGQFSKISLKVKSEITDSTVTPNRAIQLELYVDGSGNGEGLIGFGDTVLDVVASNDVLFILVDDTHPVKVTDLSPRGYFSSINVSDISDMRGMGFSFVNDFPTQFDGKQGDLLVSTRYATSENTYEAVRVSDEVSMSLVDAVNYAIDYLSEKKDIGGNVEDSSELGNEVTESFYVDSEYGIDIEGKVYSVGDTIAFNDYFQGLAPASILSSHKYKEDQRVDFTHVIYKGATGSLTVTTVSDYVQAIQTNANFNFRGFTPGMKAKEVKYALGYKVSAKDAEINKVFDENIVVDSTKGNTYYCHVGDLKVELRLNSTGLYEIYLEQPLNFN